jgi:hypothetical protein
LRDLYLSDLPFELSLSQHRPFLRLEADNSTRKLGNCTVLQPDKAAVLRNLYNWSHTGKKRRCLRKTGQEEVRRSSTEHGQVAC